MSATTDAPTAPAPVDPIAPTYTEVPETEVANEVTLMGKYKPQDDERIFRLPERTTEGEVKVQKAVLEQEHHCYVLPWSFRGRWWLVARPLRTRTAPRTAPRATPRQQQPPTAAPSAVAASSGDIARLVAQMESVLARCTALEARVKFLEDSK